jgi:hypothetical protein
MAGPPRPRRRWWAGAALPAAVAALFFLRSLRAGFTFDDRVAVQENQDVIDPKRPWSALLKDDFWGSPARLDTSNKSFRCAALAPLAPLRCAACELARAGAAARARAHVAAGCAAARANALTLSALRRPFTIAVYRLVRVLFAVPGTPLSPRPFHALNVVLHAGARAPEARWRAGTALR